MYCESCVMSIDKGELLVDDAVKMSGEVPAAVCS